MAELLGRETGYCRGKGGSMHIADFKIGMLGANGIVGGGFGIATGAALSAQLRRSGQVALCFFGDGAINQSAFHGAANLAGIWKLPLILLCENNQFAMSARAEQMVAGGDLAARAAGYGFPGVTVDGMDVVAVRAAVAVARERALAGAGPSLVVATCYRFQGHFSGDTQKYRTKEELQPWLDRDPIPAYRDRLLAEGALTAAAADAMGEEVDTAIREALDFAVASPWPEPEEAWEDVHA